MKLNVYVCVVTGLLIGAIIAFGTWYRGEDEASVVLCPLMKGVIWGTMMTLLCMLAATEHDPGKAADQPEPFFPMFGKSLVFGLASCVPFVVWQLCYMCG